MHCLDVDTELVIYYVSLRHADYVGLKYAFHVTSPRVCCSPASPSPGLAHPTHAYTYLRAWPQKKTKRRKTTVRRIRGEHLAVGRLVGCVPLWFYTGSGDYYYIAKSNPFG